MVVVVAVLIETRGVVVVVRGTVEDAWKFEHLGQQAEKNQDAAEDEPLRAPVDPRSVAAQLHIRVHRGE